MDILKGITDQYERQARLNPALLACAPLLAIAIGIYGVSLQPETSVIALLASCGIFYLLGSLTRELGKRREDGLFARWGGKPTTQLLRHRDRTLDSVTKTRYHLFLSKKIGRTFPTAAEENADPNAADDLYAGGARWLLDETRDKKLFPLLFKELIAYGFRRNSLGIKPIAIVIALASTVWILAASGVLTKTGIDTAAIVNAPMIVRVVFSINVILLATWIFFITERTVRSSAFMYADLLLRACDRL